MHSFDFDAVVYDGEIFCINCLPNNIDIEDDEVNPIFVNSEWDSYPVCCECNYEHDYVCKSEEFYKREFFEIIEKFKSENPEYSLLDVVDKENGEWKFYFKNNSFLEFEISSKLEDLIDNLECLRFIPKTKKVYFIFKNSRIGTCPYNGPTLKYANLESKYYDSEENAKKDAKTLGEYNPIGFSVTWKKVYV